MALPPSTDSRLPKLSLPRSFARSVLTVAGGSAVAQLIGVAVLPLLTRLFSPADYGRYVVFLACCGFVAPLVSGRFEMAIVPPRRRESAAAIAMGSLWIVFGMSVLVAAVVVVLGATGADVGGYGLAGMPLYLGLFGCTQVFMNLNLREARYGRLSVSRIVQAAVSALAMLGLGYGYAANVATLVVAALLGQVAGLTVLLGDASQLQSLRCCRRRRIVRLLGHYRRLALFNVPHVISDAAQGSGLPLAIGAMFGPPAAAFYSFATRLLKAPLGLVSSAISQVYFPRAAASKADNARLRRDAVRMLLALTAGALPLLLLILAIPASAYGAVFGPQWATLGSFVATLAPWMLAAFVASPLTVLFLVKERYGLHFGFAFAGTVTSLVALGVAHLWAADVVHAMAVLAFSMTVYVVAAVALEFAIILKEAPKDGE